MSCPVQRVERIKVAVKHRARAMGLGTSSLEIGHYFITIRIYISIRT
jgi:hypothetical protein